MPKPHIILVPGAWHSGDCFDELVPYLRGSGYETTALTLPSVGAEPPLKTLDPEIEHIRSVIVPLLDVGQDVVVVMHSYGGLPGSAALHGLSKTERQHQSKPGGVMAMVFLTAWMLDEGLSIRGMGGGKGGKAGPSVVKEENDKLWHLDPIPALYNDVEPALAAKAASRLVHHSLALLYQPQPYAAHKHIPTTYLVCTNDVTIPPEKQMKLVEDATAAGASVTVFKCDSGHSPFLSQPELTSKVIRHAAGEDIEVN